MTSGILAEVFARPIAHRGLHDRTTLLLENTISAAQAAIAAGFGIECDIQLSSDGEAMVFHDHTLDRLTQAQGPVIERSAAALAALTVGGSADAIPSLTVFLDAIAGRTPLVIEVKSRFDGDLRLVERLAAVLAGRGLADPVVVKSFDPAVMAHLRRIAPAIPRGIVGQSRYDGGDVASLSMERVREMTDLLHWDATRPDFLSWRYADLPAAAPYLARRLGGVPLMTWTIRNPEDGELAREHADQIVFEGFTPAPLPRSDSVRSAQ
jgi:glycerophosphoryl diester phosphodiesterase